MNYFRSEKEQKKGKGKKQSGTGTGKLVNLGYCYKKMIHYARMQNSYSITKS